MNTEQKSVFEGITFKIGKVNWEDPAVKKIVTYTRKRQQYLKSTIPTGLRLRKLFSEVIKKAA